MQTSDSGNKPIKSSEIKQTDTVNTPSKKVTEVSEASETTAEASTEENVSAEEQAQESAAENTSEESVNESAEQSEEESPEEELTEEELKKKQEEFEEAVKNKEEAEDTIFKSEKKLRNFQMFTIHALIFVFIIWLLFYKFIGMISMPNNDMYPRIDSGDLLMYYRLDKDPKAQDIICFRKNDTDYVARVIAVQGDTVEITEGSLKVNGSVMAEPNIFETTTYYEGFTTYPLTLKQGECFVLADHRNGGEDSRYYGPVAYTEIKGTVINLMRRNNL